MKIQCDVCEKAPATLICCADEAALCAKCDVEVHAANKLASKHQRLLLQTTFSNKLPPCDICQEKTAFIFCVEDRALFCRDCDEPIHSAGSLAANHQRFLATGIRVALSSGSAQEPEKNHPEPPPPSSNKNVDVPQTVPMKSAPQQISGYNSPPSWPVDDLLQFSDFESSDKKEHLEFGELEWLSDYGMFGDEAAEVPQLPSTHSINNASYKQNKLYVPHLKKPRYELPHLDEDDEEHFTVPDLG
uniref:B-box zinc finger protein 24-like n=1 Tax=Erigeron canadensis TaxID=72917 RepID=UPI001CB8C160|nr:B-box zinc finger protein 24-like [Erigeron canadensis]